MNEVYDFTWRFANGLFPTTVCGIRIVAPRPNNVDKPCFLIKNRPLICTDNFLTPHSTALSWTMQVDHEPNEGEYTVENVGKIFWAGQGQAYPNYGTTKARRLFELQYVMHRLEQMSNPPTTLADVGCGTGATVTILRELTDIQKYFCYDISAGMTSTIDTRSVRGSDVEVAILDLTNLSLDFTFPEVDLILCFGVFQCLSDSTVKKVLKALRGKSLLLRDACYLPHEGRKNINTYSKQLCAQYACHYRTLSEYISLCTDSGWNLLDIRRAFPDSIESDYGTKQWFLHLQNSELSR